MVQGLVTHLVFGHPIAAASVVRHSPESTVLARGIQAIGGVYSQAGLSSGKILTELGERLHAALPREDHPYNDNEAVIRRKIAELIAGTPRSSLPDIRDQMRFLDGAVVNDLRPGKKALTYAERQMLAQGKDVSPEAVFVKALREAMEEGNWRVAEGLFAEAWMYNFPEQVWRHPITEAAWLRWQLRLGDYRSVEARAKRLIRSHENRLVAEAYLAKMELALRQRDYLSALQTLRAISPYFEQPHVDPAFRERFHLTGVRVFLGLEQLGSAAQILERVPRGSAEYFYHQALLRSEEGEDLQEVGRLLQKAMSQSPGEPRYQVALADVYTGMGLEDGAATVLETVLGQGPLEVDVLTETGRVALRLGRAEEAAHSFHRAALNLLLPALQRADYVGQHLLGDELLLMAGLNFAASAISGKESLVDRSEALLLEALFGEQQRELRGPHPRALLSERYLTIEGQAPSFEKAAPEKVAQAMVFGAAIQAIGTLIRDHLDLIPNSDALAGRFFDSAVEVGSDIYGQSLFKQIIWALWVVKPDTIGAIHLLNRGGEPQLWGNDTLLEGTEAAEWGVRNGRAEDAARLMRYILTHFREEMTSKDYEEAYFYLVRSTFYWALEKYLDRQEIEKRIEDFWILRDLREAGGTSIADRSSSNSKLDYILNLVSGKNRDLQGVPQSARVRLLTLGRNEDWMRALATYVGSIQDPVIFEIPELREALEDSRARGWDWAQRDGRVDDRRVPPRSQSGEGKPVLN